MNDPATAPSDLDRITALLKAGDVTFWPTFGPHAIELGPCMLLFDEDGQLARIQALG